ncbi:MAG: hypothetical protein ACNS62_07800 [Candidatus Cyclobacteriaceae bacterium M3_2C_046]
MKQFFILSIALLIVNGVCASGFSINDKENLNSTSSFKIIATSKGFSLISTIPDRINMNVTVWDQEGNVLCNRKVALPESYNKPFNLSKLTDGNYTVVATTETEIAHYQIYKTGSQIEAMANSTVELHAEGKLVKIMAYGQFEKPIYVKVTNRFGNILYENTITKSKAFDLSKINSGKVIFQVNYHNQMLYKTF